ncbi:MAG: cytidylate kinase family protein [Treponema sp.]|nr:cytidylate kinase family protein [Treponema sp.]
MAIITISRELAALGDETARELTKQLGYRFVDKEALEEQIRSFGINGQKLKIFDERKPSLLAAFSHDKDKYLHYLKTAIFIEAEQGNCVFIGRGAGMVFANMPGHISLFLTAPLHTRIERVKNYFHCDEHKAKQIIERSDQDRAGFHKYYFGIDWREPENYHLSINTGIFNPSAVAEIIKSLKDRIFTEEAEAMNNICLKEYSIEQRIRHKVLYERCIPIRFFDMNVSNDVVTMYGIANSQVLIDTALEAAREAAHDARIVSEIQIVRDYIVMP